MRARLGQQGAPGVDLVADQVVHLDPAEAGGRAERPAADGADMLLELRGRSALDGPVAGIVNPRRDLVDHQRSPPSRTRNISTASTPT